MFKRIQNSWELIKASWKVLMADKELLVFPAISAVALLLVSITFIVPSIFAGILDGFFGDNANIFGYVVLFFYYLVNYFVMTFFNSALVGAANIRLEGGDPTLRDGLRIASSKTGKLLTYSAIAATVGVVLNWLRDRGILGQLASMLGGLAWSLAVYLIVPVLVMEDEDAWNSVKRSAGLLKDTWGEQIAGGFSMGAIFGLAFFLMALVLIPVGIFMLIAELYVLAVGALLAFLVGIAVIALISGTLKGIYTAALYRYATTGQVTGGFDPALIEGAFYAKK